MAECIMTDYHRLFKFSFAIILNRRLLFQTSFNLWPSRRCSNQTWDSVHYKMHRLPGSKAVGFVSWRAVCVVCETSWTNHQWYTNSYEGKSPFIIIPLWPNS